MKLFDAVVSYSGHVLVNAGAVIKPEIARRLRALAERGKIPPLGYIHRGDGA